MTKRLFDIGIASFALLAAAPVLMLVAFVIRIWMGSPVLFRQVRPGLHAQPFEMIKFRTMLDAVGPDGEPLPDGERLTGLGRFLRSTSLDELPELWNVLKGDMSLVGPRPLAMIYVPLYSSRQARRHEVRPGITGWAQVNGRNALDWKRRFELDVDYVDRHSLAFDLKILAMTVFAVLKRDGVKEGGQAEIPSFDGTN